MVKDNRFMYEKKINSILIGLGRIGCGYDFEEDFIKLYSDKGRTAKPIRLMVGLLILKQVEDLSDEVVVDRWVQNPYYQYFDLVFQHT